MNVQMLEVSARTCLFAKAPQDWDCVQATQRESNAAAVTTFQMLIFEKGTQLIFFSSM